MKLGAFLLEEMNFQMDGSTNLHLFLTHHESTYFLWGGGGGGIGACG